MFYPHPAPVNVTPSNPTAINSATYLMNGLGVAGASAYTITPQQTGRILMIVTGDLVENATAQTATVQLSFGTGTAPANAAAVAGTQQGQQLTWVSLTGILTIPFVLQTIVVNAVIGTPMWMDVNSKSSAGTIQLTNLCCIAIEI